MDAEEDHHVSSPGGFLLPSLPSPPRSTASGLNFYRALPTPRTNPLRPGTKGMRKLTTHMDDALLNISRKHVRKYLDGGYHDIASVIEDLTQLVDMLWASATPAVEISYLFVIADSFDEYLASYMPDFKAILTFLDMLDRCFYTLLTGHDASPNPSPLPPHMAIGQLTITEKVRLNSIVQRTRSHVVHIMVEGPDKVEGLNVFAQSIGEGCARGIMPAAGTNKDEDDSDDDDEIEEEEEEEQEEDEEEEEYELAVARIYERTLEEIGEQLQRVK